MIVTGTEVGLLCLNMLKLETFNLLKSQIPFEDLIYEKLSSLYDLSSFLYFSQLFGNFVPESFCFFIQEEVISK